MTISVTVALVVPSAPEGVRIHDLRHTCVALLIARGADPKAVQEHLGHSSIQVTMDRYGHLFPDEKERLADALEAAYREAAAGQARDKRGTGVLKPLPQEAETSR